MRYRTFFLAVLLAFGLPIGSRAGELPARLELEYVLLRGSFEVGAVSRRLERLADGRYRHSMWTRATGLARLLTGTEWREQGEFVVAGRRVSPLSFSETRSGDRRARERRVTFRPEKTQMVFGDGPPRTLPPGLQDPGSAIYALMLDPLLRPGERIVAVTDGEGIEAYHFIHRGEESLPTALGTRKTVVIRRVSQKRLEREQQCHAQHLKEPDCAQPDDFTLWLLPEKHYVPVKLERRRKNKTTTMVLREARGL